MKEHYNRMTISARYVRNGEIIGRDRVMKDHGGDGLIETVKCRLTLSSVSRIA